jgi:IS5 family transposase
MPALLKKKDAMEEKKTSGIKMHIGVDSNGLPHSFHAAAANAADREGALEMFRLNAERLSHVKKVLADGSYTGPNFADSVKEMLEPV